MSNVYVYDITTEDVYSEEDFGSIISSPSDSEDYQQISTSSTSQEDWFVITNSETQISFGSIGTLTGSAEELISNNYDGQGFTTISSSITNNVTFVWAGNGTLFEIGNGLERTLRPYVSSGTLRVGDSSEAVVKFATSLSFAGLTIISGSAVEKEVDSYIGFGTLTLSQELIHPNIDYTPSYTGIGTISLSGSIVEKNTESYVGLGTLTLSENALEAYSAQTPEDTQLFSISGNSSTSEIQVYGINPGNHLYPQPPDISGGTINITNTPLVHPFVDYTPHYGIDKNIGIGTTGIQLNGLSIIRETQSYVGTGLLFGFGEKLESRTYVYDEFDFIEFTSLDYGSISSTPTQPSEDNGDLTYTPSISDFGLVYDILSGQPISSSIYPFGSIFVYGNSLEKNTESYVGLGTLILSGSIVEKNTESYVGLGTLTLSGNALEAYSAQTPEDTQLFSISGNALEAYSAQTPEDTQLFIISGKGEESFNITPYFGSGLISLSGVSSDREIQVYGIDYLTQGTLTLSGSLVEKNTESYVGVGTLTLSGNALEAYSAQTPEDTQLFSISGNALEAYSAQTPEDTQLFIISGSIVEKNTESYVGLGTLTLSGSALEAYSAQTPEDTQLFQLNGQGQTNLNFQYITPVPSTAITLFGELLHPNIDYTPHYGIEKNIGIGTTGIQFVRGVGFEPDSEGNLRDARTYSNRYPINDKVPGTGVGTIRFDQINDLAQYSPLTPYRGTGLFNIISGFSPQQSYPWLPGPGVGKSWSFTRTTYLGDGLTKITGIASTREIAVYGYYGNDRDPGTSGIITISQQTSQSIEKKTESYFGTGTLILSEITDSTESRAYRGSGSIKVSGLSLNSYSANTPEDTQLFSISGIGLEVYSAQTPEIEVLYVISGTLVERKTDSYSGSGILSINGQARSIEVPNYPSRGTLRFVTHTSDNDYDTCDSEELTSDYQNSANVSFVSNPVETTVLYEFSGNALTEEIALHSYKGSVSSVLFGSIEDIKLTHSEVGSGTIFSVVSSLEKDSDAYLGSGTLFNLSGASEIYSSQTPESTVLLTISGSSDSRIESNYSAVGIGLFNFNSFAITRNIVVYTQIGSGTIVLSGELVYPDIIFIPSSTGTGNISILGRSSNSISKNYEDAFGTLFTFSSGFESFTRPTYIGIGTLYLEEVNGISINNPFQIPRTYVVII
jgi:hypothetical protein